MQETPASETVPEVSTNTAVVETVSTEIPASNEAKKPEEAPKAKTEDELRQEFQALTYRSGALQHQILMMEQELGRLNAQITITSHQVYTFEEARQKKAQADKANTDKQAAENKAKAEAKRARKAGDADPSAVDPSTARPTEATA